MIQVPIKVWINEKPEHREQTVFKEKPFTLRTFFFPNSNTEREDMTTVKLLEPCIQIIACGWTTTTM
eukprot:1924703-Amphidinium_carterae.1